VGAGLACSRSDAPPPRTPATRTEATVIGAPLAALLPGGARAVVIARPDELAPEPSVREWLDIVFTEETLERLEVRTGIRPAELTELVRADFGDDRWVWLLRSPGNTESLVRAAAMRMSVVEQRSEDPMRRTGFVGTRLRTWVALSSDCLLVAAGHLEAEVAAILQAARLHRVSAGSRSGDPEDAPWVVDALPAPQTGGYFLASTLGLWNELRAAPFVLLAPEPLGVPVDTGVGMLLARQQQLGATATPAGDALRLRVVLSGEFPPGAEDNFRTLMTSVAHSDLGRATGAEEALESFELEVSEGRVVASATWPAAGWARGVRLLGGEDPWVWVDAPPE